MADSYENLYRATEDNLQGVRADLMECITERDALKAENAQLLYALRSIAASDHRFDTAAQAANEYRSIARAALSGWKGE